MQAGFNFLLGALLCAAPVFCQVMKVTADPQAGKGHELIWVGIDDSKATIAKVLGEPRVYAEFGAGYQAWQYQIAGGDHDDFSHQLVFRKATGKLVSITRNYDPQKDLSAFFPAGETKAYVMPGSTPYSILVRRTCSDAVLLAPGLSKADQPGGQLMLIRADELAHFYPWLAEQLAKR